MSHPFIQPVFTEYILGTHIIVGNKTIMAFVFMGLSVWLTKKSYFSFSESIEAEASFSFIERLCNLVVKNSCFWSSTLKPAGFKFQLSYYQSLWLWASFYLFYLLFFNFAVPCAMWDLLYLSILVYDLEIIFIIVPPHKAVRSKWAGMYKSFWIVHNTW